MKHLCAVCDVKTGPDTPGEGISHGLCRKHELESLKRAEIITSIELAELETYGTQD